MMLRKIHVMSREHCATCHVLIAATPTARIPGWYDGFIYCNPCGTRISKTLHSRQDKK